MSTPKIGNVYPGFVSNIDHLGYHIRLTGFEKVLEGLIYKTCIDKSQSEKLIRGRCVKVEIIAYSGDHLAICLKNIDKLLNQEMNDKKGFKGEEERKVRVASPRRYQDKSYKSLDIDLRRNVSFKDEPHYYDNINNILTGLNLGTNTLRVSYNSVVTFPKTHMYNNAIRMNSQPFTDFGTYYRSSSMHTQWYPGKTLKSTEPSHSESSANLTQLWSSKKSAKTIKEQRESLPIFKHNDDLIRGLAKNQFVIVQGETGSGKSTQIPQYLLEAGIFGQKIVCTQPRKLAAKNLATRVAEEQGVAVGCEVGYKYRCCDKTSKQTMIKYCTDGTLTRECLNAHLLEYYSVIILDEAHERKIDTDVLLGYLKLEAPKRKLKVIVSSATLDAQKFSNFFFNAPIFRIKGHSFPVEIFYRSIQIQDYFNAALATVAYINKEQAPGDILLFLTGAGEIDKAVEVMEQNPGIFKNLEILPMYSTLENEELEKALQPASPGKRKVVISTNLAEASMTIPGICYVIDTGYSKTKIYHSKTGLEDLTILPVSQASADQRAGRAGRTAPGKCYRLYTKQDFKQLTQATIPEIQRSNLALIVLQLKSMGIWDVENFEFMDPPPKEAISSAENHLFRLGALGDQGYITDLGARMVQFPLEPNLSKMLISSIDLKCSDEIITIIALMGIQNVFRRPFKLRQAADLKKVQFQSDVSDLITYLNVYKKWEANNYSSSWCKDNFVNESGLNEAYEVREMLLEKMRQNKVEIMSCGQNHERIQMAITAGLALNAAKKKVDIINLGLRNKNQEYWLVQKMTQRKFTTIHLTSNFPNSTNIAW